MSKHSPAFQHYLDKALSARTREDLSENVRDCFESLAHALTGPRRDTALKDLNTAFDACRSDIRRRRMLEFCSAAIFDKPALPVATGELPEFLWLFAVPFIVTFGEEALAGPVIFEDKVVDADALLVEMEQSGYFNEQSALRASTRLFKREDLQVLGPQKLAGLFLHAELNGEDMLEPLPLLLDAEMDAYRSVTLFMLVGARLPIGQTHLFNRDAHWPAETFSRVIHASLMAQGLDVKSVQGLLPHSLAEMMFRCVGPGALELEANLINTLAQYGKVNVVIRNPIEGYAEINGIQEDGTELNLIPAFSFFETRQELRDLVGEICEQLGLPFKGSTMLNVAQPATLH